MSTDLVVKDAALQLNISEQRVRTLCRQGELDARMIGNTWLIQADSMEKYTNRLINKTIEDHPALNIDSHVNKKPIALSFFSGAMGLDLGIENAGFDIRLACEVDRFCRQTISYNRPETALLGDINEYSATDILKAAGVNASDVDLIVGGPPCQAFSTAGKRQGFNDERGNVFIKYLDLALEIRPKYIVIENVRGLLSCPMEHRPHEMRGSGFPELSEDELKGGALNFIINRLERSGYGYSFNLYNSANFGTAQIRERIIIVCSRDGQKPPFLTPTNSECGEYGLPKWNVVKDCIGNIKEHRHLNFPEKRLKYYRMLGPGQNWRNLPESIQKEAMGKSFYSGGGKTGFLRRLDWEKPSPTLVTHPAMPATDLAHPEENRPLSIEEYMAIQDFPSDWKLAGPLIQQYKQIGNAVPVRLGFAVGTLIQNLLNNVAPLSYAGFKYSRYKNTNDVDWRNDFDGKLKLLKQKYKLEKKRA
ncbi:DNA cytosine methyltransferase [Aeromonas dhakensis]|uniref:DNA cytosine methyltransferase n=1 Tax=Aeromonas dhakensis TaxID=196024 RepID=UPI003EC8DF7B